MSGADYYQVLAVTPGVTHDELKNSYRQLSLTHHPDRGGSTKQMAQLNEAYRTLSNPHLRKEYDQKLAGLELRSSSGSNYHYTHVTHAHRAAAQQERSQANFWRRFIILTIVGVAFLAYDIMSVIVLPSMVRETPRDTGIISTPVDPELTKQINAALSELPRAN